VAVPWSILTRGGAAPRPTAWPAVALSMILFPTEKPPQPGADLQAEYHK
jgi:hypothetical protein